jgi:hypothetical protein
MGLDQGCSIPSLGREQGKSGARPVGGISPSLMTKNQLKKHILMMVELGF